MSEFREHQLENIIRKATSDVVKAQVKRLDEFILNFFGSEEVARQHAHEYVIEVHPAGPDLVTSETRENDTVLLFTETTYVIRRKTPEEISLETEQNS